MPFFPRIARLSRLVSRSSIPGWAFLALAALMFQPVQPALAQTAPASKQMSSPAAASGAPVDLNLATIDQLRALPGIGDVYAKRIVDGRPYTMKNQIAQRGIVPQATYDKIKGQIVAHRAKK